MSSIATVAATAGGGAALPTTSTCTSRKSSSSSHPTPRYHHHHHHHQLPPKLGPLPKLSYSSNSSPPNSAANRGDLLLTAAAATPPSSSSSSSPQTTTTTTNEDSQAAAVTGEKDSVSSVNDDSKPQQQQQQQQQTKKNKKKKQALSQPVPSIRTLVNPVGLGRRSRQIFDEVWRKFSGLGQISRTNRTTDDDVIRMQQQLGFGLEGVAPMCEFVVPGAQNTTVLVVGATSRVGCIVVRKLMLRGYTVKALVRKAAQQVLDMLPTSVEIVVGDVGDPSTLARAINGCNKIIYCATARSSITGDLNRVDYQGVYNLTKAFQDYNNQLAQLRAGKSSKSKLLIAKFKSPNCLDGWVVRQGTYFQDAIAAKYDAGMDATFEFTDSGSAVFSGLSSQN